MEMDKPILLKTTTLLKDMLVQLGHLQLETGYLARAARTVKGSVMAGEVTEFEWTEEQEKLIQELERVTNRKFEVGAG